MEFNTYIGRAGTGKSYQMISDIKSEMKRQPLGDPIVLIAPTQSTFQLEQAFVSDHELYGSLRTEVLHFERLSHRVFQEVGGLSEERLSKSAMEMMIYDIVQNHQQELKLYHSQAKYYGFSEKLAEQIQDFKKYVVTPEDLQSLVTQHSLPTRTQHKLEDIALIYNAFERQIAGRYITSEDKLKQFINVMPQSQWLKRAEIYIDGFHNFSSLEYDIIKHLVKYAKKVTVLLTTDGNTDPFSLFRKPSEVLQHLEEIAAELNITLNRKHFNQQHRFTNHDLVHLEQEFDALQINPIQQQGHIQILEAASIREEVNEVARQIIKATREQHLRYQDIAILYRDESYAYLLASILPQFDIPFHIDIKKSMTHHPIMEMVRSLIEVMRTNWSTDAMLRLFKTDILTSQIKTAVILLIY